MFILKNIYTYNFVFNVIFLRLQYRIFELYYLYYIIKYIYNSFIIFLKKHDKSKLL